MAVCRQLGFDVTENSAIRSADAENPTSEPNMKCMEPPFWGKEGRRSAIAPFERAMVVSYMLSILTVAIFVTIRSQFAIECLRRSNQQAGGSLWAKISGGSPWSRPLMFRSAESEHPRLTNGEVISEEFKPV